MVNILKITFLLSFMVIHFRTTIFTETLNLLNSW